MILDRNTLTKEQQELEKEFWVVYKLNENWKMYLETNSKYDTFLIELEFQNTIKSLTSNYSQEEREGWDLQLSEAKKVLAWETSDILTAICTENWADINDFAQRIVDKANEYSLAYAKALWVKQAKLSAIDL